MTLLSVTQHWYCPNCGLTEETQNKPNRWHPCPKLRGLSAPLAPAGTKAKVELREREDYVGSERVQLDPERKRPVMSIVTTRDNGQDVIVFAATATGKGS
jgi:hypothetical protein